MILLVLQMCPAGVCTPHAQQNTNIAPNDRQVVESTETCGFWNMDTRSNRESMYAWIIYLCATFVASEAWTPRERRGVQIWKHRPRDAYAAFTCSLESRLPRELAARTNHGGDRSSRGLQPQLSDFFYFFYFLRTIIARSQVVWIRLW